MGHLFCIYSLEASLTPKTIYPGLSRPLSLQPLIELKPWAKNDEGVGFQLPQLSASSTFPFLSIRCPTGLPSFPWAGQVYPTRLAHPHLPLDTVLDSRVFPNPSASIKTFLYFIPFLSGFVLSYCVVLARKLLGNLIN